MGDDGRVVGFALLVVARELYLVEIVVVARRRMTVPFQSAGTALDVILRTVVPCPSAAYAGARIDLALVIL